MFNILWLNNLENSVGETYEIICVGMLPSYGCHYYHIMYKASISPGFQPIAD